MKQKQIDFKIGEREGKIRNVIRLEQIKEEQRKIEEEEAERSRANEAAAKIASQIKLKLPPIKEVQELLHQTSIEKELLDKAPILVRLTTFSLLQ